MINRISMRPKPQPTAPSAIDCWTISPMMVRSGAPISFSVAICFSFSMVIV
ncbi:hypothetical protein D3C72_2257170 [compost metagenome]